MRFARDQTTLLVGGHDQVLSRELAKQMQTQRGDEIVQVVLQQDENGNIVGNRAARRIARALKKRGKVG